MAGLALAELLRRLHGKIEGEQARPRGQGPAVEDKGRKCREAAHEADAERNAHGVGKQGAHGRQLVDEAEEKAAQNVDGHGAEGEAGAEEAGAGQGQSVARHGAAAAGEEDEQADGERMHG